MAQTIVGSHFIGGQASGNLAFGVPGTAAAGQYSVVTIYGEGNTAPTITPPAGEGYALLAGPLTNTGTNPDLHQWIYGKLIDAGDVGATHSFAVSANWRAGFLIVVSNPDQTTPNDATPTTSTSTAASTSHTAPDITPGSAAHMELFLDVFFSGAAATPPTGMSEIGEAENIYAASLYRTTSAAPGARTATGPNDRYKASHLLVREAGGGAATTSYPPALMRRPWVGLRR